MVPPGWENKIMHASFWIRAGQQFQWFSLSFGVATEAEADRAFTALAEGGKVIMPLAKTFWSPRFGMLGST
jgi:PhnB protein